MPIEIKELHIKINVNEPVNNQRPLSASKLEQEKMVARCVEEIMGLLKQKEER